MCAVFYFSVKFQDENVPNIRVLCVIIILYYKLYKRSSIYLLQQSRGDADRFEADNVIYVVRSPIDTTITTTATTVATTETATII